MKYKSRGIALTYRKQGESSIISKIFTEQHGLQSFIIKGSRSKKSKKKPSYFEPLKLLILTASFKSKKSLQYLEEVSLVCDFNIASKKIHKSFIAFFIAETAEKVLQENEQNIPLFNFIWKTTNTLYKNEEIDPNFAIKYLINLSQFLGFYPSTRHIASPFFNLETGEFCEKTTSTKIFLKEKESTYLKMLLDNQEIIIPQDQKTKLLSVILKYYKIHHYNLDSITSHLVIESLRR